MDKNESKKVVDPNESCADCKYHHCKRSCQYDNRETCLNDGECLFTGEVNRRCRERRCEHFKSWRTTKK